MSQYFRKLKLIINECAFGFVHLNINVYFIAVTYFIKLTSFYF